MNERRRTAASSRRVVPKPPGGPLAELVATAEVIVIAGSGGVGKTTTAAALALSAAQRGRRCVVVTVDPARRLADALGIDELGNEPRRIQLPARTTGEMWAMMLDPAETFDAIVRRESRNDDQVERILGNRFYRNISRSLGGTQEYMAVEKLHELQHDERFDVVIVDTPPTRNALDVLDAPGRLVRFLDHRVYRALMAPSRLGLKVANLAAQTVLRLISRVVGGEVIADVVAFFAAFEGMEPGFKARAAQVMAALTDGTARYVLVASPRQDTVAEAVYFADTLAERSLPISALVINRLHPRFGDGRATHDAATQAGRNLAELDAVADAEESAIGPLLDRASASTATCRVPLWSADINDLDALATIAHLLA